MIELGEIKIKDDISIVEAGNKIHILAQDLNFDAIAATRLATITSEISRAVYQKGKASSIKVGFDKSGTFQKLQKEHDGAYGLTLIFQIKIDDFNIAKVETFFDKLNAFPTEDGFQSIEAFKFRPDPEFEPTPQFIDTEKERLLRVSKTELFNEVKKKNIELLKLLDDRNRVLSELEAKTNELEKATRLKTEFLANMSHELRTPLNSIIGFSGRVIKKAGDLLPKRQQENLKTVLRNAHHLLGLINELLDISKIEAGKMEVFLEEFRLSDLVSEVLELTSTLIDEKELKFAVDLPEKQLVLYSDKIKLKQILINLISNAVNFTEEGSITVKAQEMDSPVDGDAFFQPEMEYVSLSVVDTGIGMNPEDLQYVFEAFRQVDGSLTRKVGGTGLGLNITKNFAELLQGKIDVDSVKGKGTTFTLT
ncbi:MAG: ATP-binding protein, partial [Desulfobacterales bacterium]|nr:ATP-binding protein [Desulfobacterales bacterium]